MKIEKLTNPVVSIIVPNYNHSDFLCRRLESIFSQTFQDFEVILLDDYSTDSSVEILNKYSKHSKVSNFIINEKNSGSPFLQWEKGINLAKGQYIWIAESDDYCDNTFLEKLISMHHQHPDISLSFCQSFRINMDGEVIGDWLEYSNFNGNPHRNDFYMTGNNFIENFLIYRNVIPNVSAVLFNRSKLSSIRPLEFYPYFKYNADWYYYLQLLCNSHVAYISKPLNYFREHSSSVIGKALQERKQLEVQILELKGRKQMLRYLQKCEPENIRNIQINAINEVEKLKFQIAKAYGASGNLIKGLAYVWNKPFSYKKIIRKYFRGI